MSRKEHWSLTAWNIVKHTNAFRVWNREQWVNAARVTSISLRAACSRFSAISYVKSTPSPDALNSLAAFRHQARGSCDAACLLVDSSYTLSYVEAPWLHKVHLILSRILIRTVMRVRVWSIKDIERTSAFNSHQSSRAIGRRVWGSFRLTICS